MGTLKAFVLGMVVMLALIGTAAAGWVPDPVSTTELAPDTYFRFVCEEQGAAMLYIPGTEGEGWLNCPRVSK